MYIFYESACIIDYCTCWIVGEWFLCIAILQECVDFDEVVSCVHYPDVSTFITDLIAINWLFLRLLNADFSCNVRLR